MNIVTVPAGVLVYVIVLAQTYLKQSLVSKLEIWVTESKKIKKKPIGLSRFDFKINYEIMNNQQFNGR